MSCTSAKCEAGAHADVMQEQVDLSRNRRVPSRWQRLRHLPLANYPRPSPSSLSACCWSEGAIPMQAPTLHAMGVDTSIYVHPASLTPDHRDGS